MKKGSMKNGRSRLSRIIVKRVMNLYISLGKMTNFIGPISIVRFESLKIKGAVVLF